MRKALSDPRRKILMWSDVACYQDFHRPSQKERMEVRTSRTSEVPCDGLWHPGPSSRPGRQGPAITFSIAGSEEGSLEFSFSFFSPAPPLPLWLSNFPSFLFYLSLPLSFLAVNTFFNSDSPKREQLNIFNKTTLLQNYSTASASLAKMTFSFLLFHTLFRRSRCLIVFSFF